jgi:vancomycin resistance protein YoaR
MSNSDREPQSGTTPPVDSADPPTEEFALPGQYGAGLRRRPEEGGTNPRSGPAATDIYGSAPSPRPEDDDATRPNHPGVESDEPASPPPAGRETALWRQRRFIIPAAVLGGLLLIYAVTLAVTGGSLARNASVLGVPVGGLSPAEAEARLAAELPARIDEPIEVGVLEVGTSFTLIPSEAGLGVDYAATVDMIPGGSPNPASLVRALLGAGEVDPVPTVDRSVLESAVEGIGADSNVEPVNGGVGFDDGMVVTSEAETGVAVDVGATADALEAEYFGGAGPHTLPLGPVVALVHEVEPAITNAEVDRAVATFAEPAMSGPVRVTAGDHTFELTPQMISAGLSMSASGSQLVPALDPDLLAEAADDVLIEVGRPGRDATIRIEGGRPVVVPHEAGSGVDPAELAAAVLPVLASFGDERAVTVEAAEHEPEFTTADAEALGVREVVSEFTTRFPHAGYRNTNIGLAAQKINNTLLFPGDEFSLNGIVGERTAARGFASGAIIEGGVLVESTGGGVSQVATTTFHTAYQAGLEVVEQRPHSIYFDRYPVGAEATVSWGNFDMRFRNDTPHGVLVQTVFNASSPGSQGSLTVRIWSTEHFRVETSTSERSNFTDPPTIYNSDDNCLANPNGHRGFSITAYRKVWNPDGSLAKDEAFPWTYRPNPEVICGEDPDDD